MVSPRIAGFVWDVEKVGRHGLSEWQVDQVLTNEHLVIRNRKARRALYLVIGRDNGGACLAVPVELTRSPMLWRPVTAWRCKDHEDARLRHAF